MKRNRKKINRSYSELLQDPATIFLGLTESNFYATKMEMKGSVRSPLTKNDLGVIKIISNKNFDYNIANNLLNTIIFNHNFNLTQPQYNLNNILDKGSFSYIATRDGIFSIYIDSINKDLLIDTNNESLKLYNNQIDKRKYRHAWKPISFYDSHHRIKKQIEFLQYYVQDASTSRKHKELLEKYIIRLNDSLNYENQKLMANDSNSVINTKNNNTLDYKNKWNIDGYFKPVDWSSEISINQKLLQDLEKDGTLSKFIDPETIAKYNLNPVQIKKIEPNLQTIEHVNTNISNQLVPINENKTNKKSIFGRNKKNVQIIANNQILETEGKSVKIGNRK